MLKVINGDLFDTKAKYICHQCNCLTTKAAHLAYDVFKRYPYADIYSCRKKIIKNQEVYSKDIPGNIIIRGNGKDQRYVVAILGQYYPGRPKYPYSKLDGIIARQQYFYQCLLKLAQIDNLESVAFPYGIGCGAAGGNINIYNKIIENFAQYLDKKVEVTLYRKE